MSYFSNVKMYVMCVVRISLSREDRLQHYLEQGYDGRSGVFDWDYHMKLQEMVLDMCLFVISLSLSLSLSLSVSLSLSRFLQLTLGSMFTGERLELHYNYKMMLLM